MKKKKKCFEHTKSYRKIKQIHTISKDYPVPLNYYFFLFSSEHLMFALKVLYRITGSSQDTGYALSSYFYWNRTKQKNPLTFFINPTIPWHNLILYFEYLHLSSFLKTWLKNIFLKFFILEICFFFFNTRIWDIHSFPLLNLKIILKQKFVL